MLAGAGQTPPPDDVVLAFGGNPAALAPLAGGQGRSWRAGPVVLKPAGDEQPELVEWLAGFLGAMQPEGAFRLSVPVAAADGRWIVGGWQASTWLDGSHVPDAWDRVLEVSAHFHRAAADVPSPSGPAERPAVLASRDDPWALGDRVAWGEREPDPSWPASVLAAFERLRPLLDRPPRADLESQVVHGDLGGNVLFADADAGDPGGNSGGEPPAVIDVSPFWRPPGYADAIVVADAVAWEGAPLTLAVRFVARQAADVGEELLAQAIAFRLATAAMQWTALPARVEAEVHGYERLLPLLPR